MPERKFSSGSYRYGFNGKEKDNEVKGEGDQQDYGMRIYDPRVGKFLSVDPLTKSYPWYTPYQFTGNSPVANIDLDGLEPTEAVKYWINQGPAVDGPKTKLAQGTASGVKKSLFRTWNFIRSDAWKISTWKSTGLFIEEGILDMSSVKVTSSPNIDAIAKDFKDNVVKGDTYSRSEYFADLGTSFFTAYAGSRFIRAFGTVVKNLTNQYIVNNIVPKIHIDIGGYGKYKEAFNYTTSTVDYEGNPIPNLVQGLAEENLPKMASNTIDLVTIENAPFNDKIMTQATRVLKSNGILSITTGQSGVDFGQLGKKYGLKLKSTSTVEVPDMTGSGATYTSTTATFEKTP